MTTLLVGRRPACGFAATTSTTSAEPNPGCGWRIRGTGDCPTGEKWTSWVVLAEPGARLCENSPLLVLLCFRQPRACTETLPRPPLEDAVRATRLRLSTFSAKGGEEPRHLDEVQHPPEVVSRTVTPQVQGVAAMCVDFCAGRVQAYVVTETSAMRSPLAKLAEGVPHGSVDAAEQSRRSLACGAGGDTQAQRGIAHRYSLPATPRPCPLVWPWRGGPAPGDSRWPSCAL